MVRNGKTAAGKQRYRRRPLG
ncbi:hypothetical protein ACSBOX_07270 [Arthrobacter sp. KN11-1C]